MHVNVGFSAGELKAKLLRQAERNHFFISTSPVFYLPCCLVRLSDQAEETPLAEKVYDTHASIHHNVQSTLYLPSPQFV